jgi:hypothetical protein
VCLPRHPAVAYLFLVRSVTRAIVCYWIACSLLLLTVSAGQDTSLQRFEAAFRRANASKDFRQLEALVYWQGASTKARREMRDALRKEFGQPIDSIQISPYSAKAAIYPPRNPTLKPTYLFTVWSVGDRDNFGQQIVGTFYTLGRKDAQVFLVVSDQWPVSSVHYR